LPKQKFFPEEFCWYAGKHSAYCHFSFPKNGALPCFSSSFTMTFENHGALPWFFIAKNKNAHSAEKRFLCQHSTNTKA
jgi:hypothetical protein